MRKKKCILVITLILSISLLFGCGKADKSNDTGTTEIQENVENAEMSEASFELKVLEEGQQVIEGIIETQIITSECLSNNIIGENLDQTVYVYLPPSYQTSEKKYPVVYFLHGYGDNSQSMAKTMKGYLDPVFTANPEMEFIFVAYDGNNRTGGSFYVNSPVSGNWEDFVVEEVTGRIDSTYRTIQNKDARMMTGYSMGGYGAINAALKHPDVFGSLLVFCPGIYAEGALNDMWNSWSGWTDVKNSYAQAFAPNTQEAPYGYKPEFSGTEEDNEIVRLWDSGYGNWAEKLDTYINLNTPLRGIQINYSNNDNFRWIPAGCLDFAGLLEDRNISYEINEFSGGHIVPKDICEKYLLPFSSRFMMYEE